MIITQIEVQCKCSALAVPVQCKFYKVDSLAGATRISHNYQVLLDDGNRIIIPRGNFKVHVTAVLWLGKYRSSQ